MLIKEEKEANLHNILKAFVCYETWLQYNKKILGKFSLGLGAKVLILDFNILGDFNGKILWNSISYYRF